MKEAKALKSVAKFHQLFDLPVVEHAAIPSKERCQLRINLLEEELRELKQAIENNNIVEVADAFCDLQYVLSGAILEFGLGRDFKRLFGEVQRSNMSKACATLEEAEATLKYYKEERNTEGFIKPKDDKFLVYRKEDTKVLKSVNYSEAELEKFISTKGE